MIIILRYSVVTAAAEIPTDGTAAVVAIFLSLAFYFYFFFFPEISPCNIAFLMTAARGRRVRLLYYVQKTDVQKLLQVFLSLNSMIFPSKRKTSRRISSRYTYLL